MSLNSASIASTINSTYQSIVTPPLASNAANNVTMANAWKSAIHSDAMAGVVPIASSAAPANSGIIYSAMLSVTGSRSATVDVLANMFASYWATSHLTPKAPAVTIVGNDAASKVSAYKAALQSIITTNDTSPYFKNVFDAVQAVTKTIIWTGFDSQGRPLVGTVS